MRRKLWLVVAGILAATLTACSAPGAAPAQTADTPTPSVTPSPTPTPPPNLPKLTPPQQFDVVHTVRLAPADQVSTGTLSGDDFFTVNADTIWGVNVHDGSVAFGTPLGDGPVACWHQAVDGTNVYTVTMSASTSLAAPAALRVTAIDRTSGAVAWTFQPPATSLMDGAGCRSSTSTLTVTSHGLLLSLTQTDTSTLGNPVAALSWMLDPATGHPLWQTATDVMATNNADFGVSVALATVPTPMGVFFYQASPVDLATGEIGRPFWQTDNSMQLAGRYQLAGRAGGELILLAHTAGSITTTTTVYGVSAATGEATSQPITQLQSTNLADCQVTGADRLVCTATNDPVTAFGISLTDGTQVWQHVFKATGAANAPILVGSYLYGFDPGKNISYVLDTTDGSLLQEAAYPAAIAVNETGLVFNVPQGDGRPAWQCWWAPALA